MTNPAFSTVSVLPVALAPSSWKVPSAAVRAEHGALSSSDSSPRTTGETSVTSASATGLSEVSLTLPVSFTPGSRRCSPMSAVSAASQ